MAKKKNGGTLRTEAYVGDDTKVRRTSSTLHTHTNIFFSEVLHYKK